MKEQILNRQTVNKNAYIITVAEQMVYVVSSLRPTTCSTTIAVDEADEEETIVLRGMPYLEMN
jgi:hypothetical protein